jgi:hypothetical protein
VRDGDSREGAPLSALHVGSRRSPPVTIRAIFPTLGELRTALGALEIVRLPIPHDCVDGFLGAYWRRPYAYLDAGVRSAISTFSRLDAAPGLARLRADLEDGAWQRRHARLLDASELDLGYRLVIHAR